MRSGSACRKRRRDRAASTERCGPGSLWEGRKPRLRRASLVPPRCRGFRPSHRTSDLALPMKLCGFDIGPDRPFFLIAGPCVVESEQLQLDVAGKLKEITTKLGINFIFKSSFDKANRSSAKSFR